MMTVCYYGKGGLYWNSMAQLPAMIYCPVLTECQAVIDGTHIYTRPSYALPMKELGWEIAVTPLDVHRDEYWRTFER